MVPHEVTTYTCHTASVICTAVVQQSLQVGNPMVSLYMTGCSSHDTIVCMLTELQERWRVSSRWNAMATLSTMLVLCTEKLPGSPSQRRGIEGPGYCCRKMLATSITSYPNEIARTISCVWIMKTVYARFKCFIWCAILIAHQLLCQNMEAHVSIFRESPLYIRHDAAYLILHFLKMWVYNQLHLPQPCLSFIWPPNELRLKYIQCGNTGCRIFM